MLMMLKPQDIVVLLKLVARGRFDNYRLLAKELFMSLSEVHKCVERAGFAQLLDRQKRMPRMRALEEFLVHGIRYSFPVQRGSLRRGLPTSYGAPPLKNLILHSEDQVPVWSYARGPVRGYALEPLFESVPLAALEDEKLYELLALVDAIREGRVRERSLAAEELVKRLRSSSDPESDAS